MRSVLFAMSILLLGSPMAAQQPQAALGATLGEDDGVFGNWEGRYTLEGGIAGALRAQIIAEGEGAYRAILQPDAAEGPGAFVIPGKIEGEQAAFAGRSEGGFPYDITFTAARGSLKGRFRVDAGSGAIEMKKVYRKPPALGAAPPAGAVVLFDGRGLDAWTRVDGAAPEWLVVDGAMQNRGRHIISREKFGDVRLHAEFRTPLKPEARGQRRGNSGVYFNGRYEIQVLDSFGLPAAKDEAGAIYNVAAPRVNASLPPLEWQTYEAVFCAPRFDEEGRKTADARLTVRHNGVLIHDNVAVPEPTSTPIATNEVPRDGIMLQSMGSGPVQYRNIWALPVDCAQGAAALLGKP
jgi:hypothetical protein